MSSPELPPTSAAPSQVLPYEPAAEALGRTLERALAVERSMTRTSLARVAKAHGASASAVDTWLEGALSQGAVEPVAVVFGLRVGIGAEARFCLPAGHEQRLLRELLELGQLETEVPRVARLVGERSLAALQQTLTLGDLAAFDRQLSRASKLVPISGADWLKRSVADAFDPAWFAQRFGDQVPAVCRRVLAEALSRAADCSSLYEWAIAAPPSGSHALLADHALLRGETQRALLLADELPPADAELVRSVAAFQQADLEAANQHLAHALRGRTQPGAASLVHAVLLLEQDDREATAQAKKLIARVKGEQARGFVKGFRLLVREQDSPESNKRRLDVFQMPADVSVWEFLLTALTVQLHSDNEPIRASWASHLARRALQWRSNGYHWIAKQSLLLARELHAAHCDAEVLRHGVGSELLVQGPRDVGLWDRLSAKPEWKRALEALSDVSAQLQETELRSYRVRWTVDTTHLTLRSPILERYDAARGGWNSGRPASLGELSELGDQLPVEDRVVLGKWLAAKAKGYSEPTDEDPASGLVGEDLGRIFDALVGHPRVRGRGRGGENLNVLRGTCRVVTQDGVGGIRVAVEPEGALLGFHVVRDSATQLSVYHVGEALHRVMKALPRGVRVPRAHERELLEVLGRLAANVPVESPHLGAEEVSKADSTPCLRIASQSGAFQAQLGVRPFGSEGRFFAAAGGPRTVHAIVSGKRLRAERDFAEEETRGQALIDQCPALAAPNEDDTDVFLDEEGLLGLLAELRDTDVVHHLEWRGTPGVRLSGSLRRSSLRGRLRCIKGWYVADGVARLDDGTEAVLADLCEAQLLGRGRFIRVAPGQYAEVEASMRRTLAALRLSSKARDGGLRIHPVALGALQALSQLDGSFAIASEASQWLARVDTLKTATFEVPPTLHATLRSYQQEGFRWLRALMDLEIGACLADDMGLGKTLQVLAVIADISSSGPNLIVAPTSVCTNWLLESARFAPSLEIHDYAGPNRREALAKNPTGTWVTSYAVLQQDATLLASQAWNLVVLDEAQFIKNAGSLRARAAFDLRAKWRIAVTGTPVENNLGDLWSIFRFLNPGLLGEWARFRREFVLPVERDGSTRASAELRELVSGYVLRRMKGDVLGELPPLTQVDHDVELSEEEVALYALLREQVRGKLFGPGRKGRKIEALAEITRLRRFCCHPKLVFPDVEVPSSKLDSLLGLLEDLRESGHRTLVFSQFVDFLSMVREQLDERRIAYAYLDGSTPRAARQARVDAFQKGDASLFLISLKAGGFGLNLTAADYVIHADPWWNPAVESQATDRAHRMGQTRPVTVYRLITKQTIERKIVELQYKKQELAEALLDGTDLAAKLSTDDLIGLLSGGE